MKANELMIGDWVRMRLSFGTQWYIDKVGVINPENEMVYEPIPLTEEILKANGFTTKTTDYSHIEIGNKIIISFHFGKTLRITDYNKGFEVGHVVKEIWHVHDLQHALRLCGLNDIADNFKVN